MMFIRIDIKIEQRQGSSLEIAQIKCIHILILSSMAVNERVKANMENACIWCFLTAILLIKNYIETRSSEMSQSSISVALNLKFHSSTIINQFLSIFTFGIQMDRRTN